MGKEGKIPAHAARFSELVRPSFPERSRTRGDEYFRRGRVELGERSPKASEALVRGTSTYLSLFARVGGTRWTAQCTCPHFGDGFLCKHLWAHALALDEVGWSPFRDPGSVRSTPVPSIETDSWRLRLDGMRRAAPPPAHATAPSRGFRILCALRVEASRGRGGAVIDVLRVRRLKSGAWSNPVLLRKKDLASLGDLDPRQRTLLSILESAGYAWSMSSTFELEVPEEVCEWLLPMIAECGVLHWSDELGRVGGPAAYDTNERWRCERRLVQDKEIGDLEITGRWTCGERAYPFEEVLALVGPHFALFRDRLARIAENGDIDWSSSLFDEGPVFVPAGDADELLHKLSVRGEELTIDPSVTAVRHDVEPAPRLTLDPPAAGAGGELEVTGEIAFDYAGQKVVAEDAKPLLRERSRPSGGRWIARRTASEETLRVRAFELGARPLGERRGALVVPLARVPELVRTLNAEGWRIEGDGARFRSAVSTSWSVTSGIDWLELGGEVDFGGATAKLPELIAAARKKQRTVTLGDGSIGMIPEEWLARFGSISSFSHAAGGKLRFRRSQAWLLETLLAGEREVRADASFSRQLERLKAFRGIEAAPEPAGFRGELRSYQREGLGWLRFLEEQGFGGCLADDMGLGKTVQVLAWLVGRRAGGKRLPPALVVAPKSLTHNWIEEARRFAPGLSVLDHTGTARKASFGEIARHDIVVTTYGSMRGDAERLADEAFDCVILDEAQAIKNAASRTAKAALLLRAEHRIALSGTPIENHLGELWSLFEFLNPGMLGRSAVFAELVGKSREGAFDDAARSRLATAIRPFVLRRTKEQVLRDLPEKTEQTVTCVLDAKERRRYDELRDHYRRALLAGPKDERLEGFRVLEALLRLRQAACHPGLLDPGRAGEPSAKLEALLESVAEVVDAGHKALVFSQFTSFLAIVRQRLDAIGTRYAYLDGSTPARERAEQVRLFQEDAACPLFLASLKAGGVGLNLTAADYVFLLDPWWNPAVESQAVGRAHRIGQTRTVFAYRFVCADTIEDRVLELQSRKRELAAVILEGESTTLRDLSRADLERLLG